MLIAGDDDVAAEAVSFRYRDGSQSGTVAKRSREINDCSCATASRCSRVPDTDPDHGSPVYLTIWAMVETLNGWPISRGRKPAGRARMKDCPFDRAPKPTHEEGLIVAGRAGGRRAEPVPVQRRLCVDSYRHLADDHERILAETAQRPSSPSSACCCPVLRLQHRHQIPGLSPPTTTRARRHLLLPPPAQHPEALSRSRPAT